MNRPPLPIPVLCEQGQIYVTLAAAEQYAEQTALQIETARRELTERLLDAHRTDFGPPELWRARSRPGGFDISARVTREGRLYVVLAARFRNY